VTEPSSARSHAGSAAIAVGASARSIESCGTAAEGIPVTCSAAREVSAAYPIGSAGANAAATGAIRTTNTLSAIGVTGTLCTVGDAGVSAHAAYPTACRRPTAYLSALSRELLPCTGLPLGK